MGRLLNARSRVRLLAGIIIFFLSWCPLWTLDPDKKLEEYLIDRWDTSNGIPSNMIYSITQTPDGYLWIATNKGLVRFDGITFSTVSFAREVETASGKSAVPEALHLDSSGILWIGSNVGLTSYDRQARRFTTFTTANGLSDSSIRRLLKDKKGNLWIGFETRYVNRFFENTFTAYDDSDGLTGIKTNALVENKTGDLLVGTRDDGIFAYRGGKFHPFVTGLPGFLINMWADQKNNLWICTSNGLLEINDKIIETYTRERGLSDSHTSDILEDSRGTLWVGSTKGLNRRKKESVGSIGFDHILEPYVVVCLFEDREGSLWIGTYGSGLLRLKDRKFHSYAPLESFPGEVFFSMYRDRQGNTWIGTDNGKLLRFRDNESPEIIGVPGLSGVGIPAIADDAEGNLWIGTNEKGVFQRKNNTFSRYSKQNGLIDDFTATIFRDSRGDIWFGTYNGASVFRHANADEKIESIDSRDGLQGKIVYCICEDKDKHICLGTDNGITVLKDGKIEKDNMPHYLEGVPVTWIYEDPAPPGGEGRVLWIATHGAGLKRLRIRDKTVTTYIKERGMATNFIYRFFQDKKENFWFMSDSGILRIAGSELDDFAFGKADWIDCISYGSDDGLISPEFSNPFSRHSAFRTREGELWFLNKKGISIVNPGTIQLNNFPPPVVIEEVLFNRQSIPLPLDVKACVFKGIGEVRFSFTAPTLLSAERVTFKCILEGADKKWKFLAPGSERAVNYKNLGPGTYTFRVTACNAEGVWNTAGTSVTFTLTRSFAKTFLFKMIIFLLFTGLSAAVFYIHKKRPSKEKENGEKKEREGVRTKVSPLPRAFVEECIRKLRHLMEVERVYRDETMTIRSLAEKLSIPYYQLSQVLNDALNRSFPDFINYYRIEEAKKILLSPEGAERKISTVSQDVGFNSMTAFYKAFKKQTGMTPNQYKKEAASS